MLPPRPAWPQSYRESKNDRPRVTPGTPNGNIRGHTEKQKNDRPACCRAVLMIDTSQFHWLAFFFSHSFAMSASSVSTSACVVAQLVQKRTIVPCGVAPSSSK